MRRRLLLTLLVTLVGSGICRAPLAQAQDRTGIAAPATAAPPSPELASLRLQSQTRMRFFGLSIYDIQLWALGEPVTAGQWREQRFVLSLVYARHLEGEQIAQRSLKEMRRQGALSEAQGQAWLAQMRRAFPDVQEGDRLSGLHEPGLGATFFVNGRAQPRINDAAFAERFFGIWLAEQSSEPRLREALLNPTGAVRGR